MDININKYWNQIRKTKELNVFSPSYDIEIVKKKIDELCSLRKELMKSSNDDSLPEIVDIDFLLNTFISIFKISNLYPDAYKKMKLDIINSNCSEEELYLFSAIHLNRNYILVSDKRLSTVKQRKVLNIGVIESMAITSLDQSIGELNATSTMEGDVDALNLIFNYLYYFNNSDINEFDSNKPHVYPVEQIKKIFGVAEILNAVKTGFESAIWKYGLACYSSKLISLIFRDIEKVKLEYAGLMQFKDITFSNLISPPESIKNEAIAIYNKHINKRILDKIEITNGILKFSFLDGDDIFELNEFIYHQIQVSCFYSFISNETFSEQYSCLDTTSCILMFSIISNLLKKIKLEHITPDDSIFNKNDFYKFPIKILIDDVKNILADKTNFKLAQIDAFISILSTDKSNRMNLWETPLVKIDNYFILILMPVCEPVLCRMVDVWLQKGGIPLDKRGHKFELYVKEVLNRILKAKGISFCILNINKFKNRNDEFEEIDLLIELEDKIIIGEVKCILYPMTNRDYYNSFETLKKGCKQLIRKTDFLLRNKKLFSKSIKNIDESNIIKMVITNFPIYSGQSYKGVPIVDIHLLEKYFLKGKHIELEFDSNKKTNIEKIAKIYYNNNTEMVANLNSFINSPKLIQYFYNKIEINTSKLTPLGFGYDIFIQDPYFKE